MTRRAALLLRLSVVWTLWVWVVLIRNMITDHSATWSFRLIHIGLAVVSIAFAVVVWQVTSKARRFTRDVDRTYHVRPAVSSKRRGAPERPTEAADPIVVSAKPAD